jgi:hypothetical protein
MTGEPDARAARLTNMPTQPARPGVAGTVRRALTVALVAFGLVCATAALGTATGTVSASDVSSGVMAATAHGGSAIAADGHHVAAAAVTHVRAALDLAPATVAIAIVGLIVFGWVRRRAIDVRVRRTATESCRAPPQLV